MMTPANTNEVVEAVRSHPRVVVRGGGTKSGPAEGPVLDLTGLSGLTEYQASEFTFTARAGTRVSEVMGILAEKGQHLPFDPHWVDAGATLGGTVAAGISGPGRFRFGGLRDFLLGIEFVDGTGAVVRSGGRVVKNAAGFDLSKFMVGSLGGFGVLTELTFKVFPVAQHTTTLRIGCAGAEEAVRRIVALTTGRLEAEAVEFGMGEFGAGEIHVRIGAAPEALDAMCAELESEWPGDVTRLDDDAGRECWAGLREMQWTDGADCLVKVLVTPSRIVELERGLEDLGVGRRHFSSGGVVGWLAFDREALGAVDALLGGLDLRGMMLRANAGERWMGLQEDGAIIGAVKQALDPEGRFPAI